MDQRDQPVNASSPQPNHTAPRSGAARYTRRAFMIDAGCLLAGGLYLGCIGACVAPAPLVSSALLGGLFASGETGRPEKSSGTPLVIYRDDSGGSFTGVAWSPDGKRIASAGHSVQVWNALDGTRAFTCPHTTKRAITRSDSIAWSPDGQFIAAVISGWDNSTDTTVVSIIQIWNASNGKPVATYTSASDLTDSLAWSPDGKHIAYTDHNVRLLNVSTGSLAYTYPEVGSSVTWSPDGKRLACIDTELKRVESWDASDGGDRIVYWFSGDDTITNAIVWSPDSKYLACTEPGAVEIWNASTGHSRTVYDVHGGAITGVYSNMGALAWSPDGKRMATGGADKMAQGKAAGSDNDHTVEVCDALTGKHVFAYTGHSDRVIAIAWSPDGKYIASASLDNTAQVWSPR